MSEEQARAASAALAVMLVEESPDALLSIRFDGSIVSWNRGAAAIRRV
jgi:hypothetical protein